MQETTNNLLVHFHLILKRENNKTDHLGRNVNILKSNSWLEFIALKATLKILLH
jgi:hypothetical protein